MKAILSAETILARFDTLGKETFPRALQATVDLGTRTGDLAGTAQRLGRALQSPVQGLGMLAEAGVTFTAQQQAQVKALAESGRVLEAQEILLGGIERAYGGAAFAATQTFGGALTQLQEAFGDLLENPGGLQANVGAVKELTGLLQDPTTVQAANTLTGALFTGFQAVVALIVGSVNGVRDLSQEAARVLSGGIVPIDEIDARIAKLESRIKALREVAGPEDPSPTGDGLVIERIERELTELRARRAQFADFLKPPAASAAPAVATATSTPTTDTPLTAAELAARDKAAAAAAKDAYATLRATVDQQLAELRARTSAELTDLDRRLNEASTSFANAAAERVAAQRALIDAEIAGLQQQLAGAGSPAERIALETRITALFAEREQVAIDATRAQADAQRGLAGTLQDLSRDLQRATGESLRAEMADIEDRYRDTLARLKIEGNEAGVSLVQQLIGAEQDQARLAEFERRVADLQNANAARQQSIANQRVAGVISERRAAQELIDANLETADSLRAVVEEYRALAVAAGDTAALARIEEITGAIITLEDTTSQAARSMAQTLRGGLEDVFKAAITDIRDLDSALSNFFANIASQLAAQAGQNIVSGLFGEEGGKGDLLEKLGGLLTGDFGGDKPASASPLSGVSYARPLPVTLVGPGGVGGSIFGDAPPSDGGEGGLLGPGGIGGSLFDGSFFGGGPNAAAEPSAGFGGGLFDAAPSAFGGGGGGSSLLGSGGIGGGLFGGAGSDPAALADTIGGDLVAAFDAASAAGAGLADVGLQWGGQGIDFAGDLAAKLTGGTGAAFQEASSLASSFFSSQAAGIASTTAASTAAAATTTATATASNTAIAASAAPAAALTSIASFGGSAIAAAVAIPLVTAAIGALLTGAFATGGIIDGEGTGTSDSNLALVSDGEAIIPARVVNALGEPFFEDLIDGRLPAFADGGVIDLGMSPRIAGGGLQRLSDESIARTALSESPAASGPGFGAMPAPEVRINNIVDPSTVRNFLTSPDGSRVIVNVIRDNPSLFPGGSRR